MTESTFEATFDSADVEGLALSEGRIRLRAVLRLRAHGTPIAGRCGVRVHERGGQLSVGRYVDGYSRRSSKKGNKLMIPGASIFLYLLPLAAAPVLFHLLMRRQRKTVLFSTRMFLTA